MDEGKKEILSSCNKIYNEGEWPNEFMETVLPPIPKKNNAKKCSHTAKIILRILNRSLCSKMEEQQFGFRKGKGTRDAIGLIQTSEKAFDREDWKKLMGILKKIGVDWKERRLLSKLYMEQRIKVRIGEEMSERREIGRGVW